MNTSTIRCVQCGGPVKLEENTQRVACPACGTVNRRDAAQSLPGIGGSYPNPTPLRQGMTAMWHAKQYVLTGRVVYSEQDDDSTSYWHEFQLVSDDGHTLYLEFDEGKWKLMEPFVPQQPLDPLIAGTLKAGAKINLEGSSSTVTEAGKATIHAVEGELTWTPRKGETAYYLDAGFFGTPYSMEWDHQRVEYFRGQRLSEREVLSFFGLKEEMQRYDRLVDRRMQRLRFGGLCLACSLFAFIAGAKAMNSGRVISRSSVQLNSVGPDGVRFNLGRLNPGRYVHRLAISGSMSEASAWVAGVLEAADGRELVGTQGDFWDESGRDSDGYWHESYLNARTDFVVARPGPYQMRLYVEKDTPRGSFNSVGYELREGVTYPSYYFTYGWVTILIGAVFLLSSAGTPSVSKG